MRSLFYVFLALSFALPVRAAVPADIRGKDLFREKPVDVKPGKAGLVVVFLSAKCPCSASHIDEIRKLSQTYKDFQFVGVHANPDESREISQGYFRGTELPFPVIQDTGQKLAGELGANRTPHAFVLRDGKALYRGGVSDSKDCVHADRYYLREALADLAAGHEVRTPETRTLGCAISRGGKNDW